MSQEQNFKINLIFKGCIFSLISTLILVFLVSLLYYFSNVSDNIINIILFSITVISVFLGGLITAKKAESRGLIYGLFSSVAYFIIIFAVSIIINKQANFTPHFLSMLFAGLASGMLGGIVGVNSL